MPPDVPRFIPQRRSALSGAHRRGERPASPRMTILLAFRAAPWHGRAVDHQNESSAHGHSPSSPHEAIVGAPPSRNRLAANATTHCLTGCAIGEVLGLVVSTQLGWGTEASIALAIALSYVFGYALTLRPLLGSGLSLRAAAGVAFAADTLSITVMEIVDNAIVLLIPGAMAAGLTDLLFWSSL